MELLQLRYFCVVARHENMTRASEELRVAQPSLSKTIKRLEEELGAPLFNRQGKRLQLNSLGNLFYRKISENLDGLDAAVHEVRDAIGSIGGSVSIWITSAINIMPRLFSEFQQAYPHIIIKAKGPLVDFDPCVEAEFDVVFFGTPDTWDTQDKVRLLEEEEMMLAVPKGHPLAQHPGPISLALAEPYPFISYSKCSRPSREVP